MREITFKIVSGFYEDQSLLQMQFLQNMCDQVVIPEIKTSTCRSRNPMTTKTRGKRGNPVASGFCFLTRQSTGRGVWRLGRVLLSRSLCTYRSSHTHLPFPVARTTLLLWAHTSGRRGNLFRRGFVMDIRKGDTRENSTKSRHPALLARQSR